MFLQQIFLLVTGLAFGSFVAALSYRYPKQISILGGRSFCDNCKKKIEWYDNIPLVSYIVLFGKCRHCGYRISLRYPLIEFATAIGFVLIGFQVFQLILLCLLELIFVIDLETQIIPDVFIFVALLIHLLAPVQLSVFANSLAGFSAASFLLLIYLATKGKGMGLGDVKFAVLGGMITGGALFPIWLLLAFLTGGIVGTILILGKRAGLKDKIAFGPFLVAAIPVTLIWGQGFLAILGLVAR